MAMALREWYRLVPAHTHTHTHAHFHFPLQASYFICRYSFLIATVLL